MKKTNYRALYQVWKIFYALLFPSIFIAVFFFTSLSDAITFDFISMLTGAKMLISGDGQRLYDAGVQLQYQGRIFDTFGFVRENNNFLPFLNLPVLAVFFIPFTYLPFFIAYKIYVILLSLVLFLISYLIPRYFKNLGSYSV